MTEPIRLLIVDDHPLVIDGLIARLQSDPEITVVGQAGNGQEALGEARRLCPDVVLMDIKMPVMDGIEATRRLLAELPQTQVLILSSYNEHFLVEQSQAAGACGYVLKNARAEELRRVIVLVHNGGRYFSKGVIVDPPRTHQLTPREIEVLCCVVNGKTNKQIARLLTITVRTVEQHRENIRNKIGLNHVADWCRFAIEQGLCPAPLAGQHF